MSPVISRPVLSGLIYTVFATACTTGNGSKLPSFVDAQSFAPLKSNFKHSWNKDDAFPFTGGAAIDINNDGQFEVFVSGGDQQQDTLLSLQGDTLVNIIDETGLSSMAAGYGATAIDMNDDGRTDLLVARDDGVWLYQNQGGQFSGTKIQYKKSNAGAVLAVAVADYDKDGDIDLYLSNFIEYENWVSSTFNNPDNVRTNQLLRNDGNLQFTDVTSASGTAGTQNTFLSVFTDLDADGFQDLVISNNTGRIEILHNEGNGSFTSNTFDSGLGYWMGIGVGDFDADGDQDLALSNVSNSIPSFALQGDLRDDQQLQQEWALLENRGDRVFAAVTEQTGLTDQGFGWGIVFEDLNLDGHLDLLAAQSYIKWPLQVVDNGNRKFVNAPGLGLVNKNFGQTAIVADLNGDARQDVVWINMNGPILLQ